MSSASRIPVRLAAVWLLVLGARGSVPGQAPGATEEGRASSAAISPNGKWLVIQVTETGELPVDLPPEVPEYLGGFLNTGRKLYRVALSAKSPRVAMIHETKAANRKSFVLQKMQSIQSPLILDDGTAVALKDRLLLARWAPTGKLTEKKILEESRPLKLHLAAGGKKLLLDQDVLGRSAAAVEVLDLKTHEVTRPAWMKGLQGSTIHWATDLKLAYGVEPLPGAAPAEKTPVPRSPRAGRLVRVSTGTGERVTIAPNVPLSGVVHGKDSILWSQPGAAGRPGSVWRARRSVDFTLEELTGLEGWEPVLALDEERFLLKSIDRGRHGIADLAAPAEGAGAPSAPPTVKPIPLPPHVRLLYSPALKGFVLAKDALTWTFVDLNGKAGWTFRLGA